MAARLTVCKFMLTFVIPVSPYHEAVVETAIASCLTQTITCSVVVVYDHDRRGAGWARNRGLERVQSDFCSFLDADDWVTPDFAEKCLRAYDGRHYVYTDWWGWALHPESKVYIPEIRPADDAPWTGKNRHHIVTTLLPTAFVRYVGGFDEALPGWEDTDFYLKLTRSGLCGTRLPEALFHYGKDGQRAQAFLERPDRDEISRLVVQRYERLPMPCTDCGGNPLTVPDAPLTAPEAGDVLAEALWQGNRQERGRMTGRLYPKSGWRKRLWVSPADIDATPHLFARVVEMPAPIDDAGLQAWRQFTGDMRQALGVNGRDVSQTPAPAYAVPGEVAPDVGRVLRLYQQNVAQSENRV